MSRYDNVFAPRIVGYGSNSIIVAAPHSHEPSYSQPDPYRIVIRPVHKVTEVHRYIPVETVTIPIQQNSQPVRQRSAPVVKDPFHAEQYQPSRGTSAKIPNYNSLDDPHMQHYFKKRFGQRFHSSGRMNRYDTLYRITVKTADVKNAGTNAKVFLSVFGSRDRICRKYLTRESMLRGQPSLSASLGRIDRDLDNEIYNVEFKRDATDTFFIRCRDLGNLRRIRVEHTGLLVEQAWLCEFILITNVRTSRSWFFPCNVWLSLFEPGDGSLFVDLFPSKDQMGDGKNIRNRPKETQYEITVVTGDQRGAGTDANVFITLFSENAKRTDKIPLKKSLNNSNPFERNQSDQFQVRADYIGDLLKLRIEHDNSGRAPGWFLERIVIVDLHEPEVKYYASCQKWLAKSEGDGQISRDLILNKEIDGKSSSKKYKLTILTGNKTGAGTDADVFITLHGRHGDSGSIMLDAKSEHFESGSKDEFIIECPDVGTLTKLLVAHNNKGRAPGWFLDKIYVEDLSENKIYEFPCNKWLATDEDDGQISRFLFPKKSGGDDKVATAGIPYTITVHTGNKSNAGTDAKVYIVMHRKGNTSGKLFLPDGKFEKKSIDEISIDGPEDFSPLSGLDIGHDNSGSAPGWFLDKVVVDCPSTGITQTFPCERWLAKDEDDHLIERHLKEDKSLRKTRPPTVPWYIWVYTSSITGAGTDAQVFLTLYGRDGRSDEIALNNKSDPFEAGKCDEFKRNLADVGIPYKLRVRHDNTGAFASWHLDRIEVENLATRERYTFTCGRWLSKKEDDKQIIRELPADGPHIKKPLPVIKYHVDVHTSNIKNAGTDANVFLTIFGELGDTGERPLEHSSANRNKFERNQVDKFSIEAVSLKQLEKVFIRHDNSGSGPGWHLDKVVVTPDDSRYKSATFLCNRWLAEDEDDGRIALELKPEGSSVLLEQTRYVIKTKTGKERNAGTDADVYIQLYGKNGQTEKVRLHTSENTKNKFESGQTDIFNLDLEDIGKIQRLKIGHNGKGVASGWFLDSVEVSIPTRGEVYRFACHRWLAIDEGDKKIEIEIEPSEIKKLDIMIPYEIHVFTGKEFGAGTDANVFIQMYGDGKKTEKLALRNRSDNFENGQEDVFKLEAHDVGEIQKIRVGHDNKGGASAWYLEKILIRRHIDQAEDRRKREFRSSRSHRLSQISATDPSIEEYWFVCRKWFDAGKGDRQIVRDLLPTDEHGTILSDNQEVQYEIHVFTGDVSGAGTDANVFITLFGENGDSGERALEKSRKGGNKFERKKEDVFDVPIVHLGKLKSVRIRHDNSGVGAAWFLDRIEITDPLDRKDYHFICKKWLSEKDGDGMIVRELPALENRGFRSGAARINASESFDLERKELLTTYKVKVTTGDKFGSGTNANVYLIIFGEDEDTGEVPLTRSKTHKDPFERGHTDEFEIESGDIGKPKKIRIGHDDAGLSSDWFLERVEIDVPKFGRQWTFPCGNWISSSKGDRQLELELYPEEKTTEVYNPQVPYEITVYTSNISGAGTDADVFIQIYGEEACTEEKMLFSKTERPGKFQKGSVDSVTLELDDVGRNIKKIRIGHNDKGWGAAWHLDRVEIRRLLEKGKSETYVFPCSRWFSKKEDDKQIIRELLPEKTMEEGLDKSGQIRKRERSIEDRLEMKTYQVEVYTGDVGGAGTNANVFLTLFGDKGDSGERELRNSETHTDKFERNHMDKFRIECADLGTIFKAKVRHDDSGLRADWFLNRIEVIDDIHTYTFHCEQWLRKSGDSKPEKSLYEKDYQGSKSSFGSIKRSVAGSVASLTSNASSQRAEPFRANQRRNQMAAIAEDNKDPYEEGIPYTVRVKTGDVPDGGTKANVMIRFIGKKGKKTRKIPLEVAGKNGFRAGKTETFSLQEQDIGDLTAIEIEHDGATKSEGWFLDSVMVELPTKGSAYNLSCRQWLSKEEGDGQTRRILEVGESGKGSFRPLIPYEITFYTGDVDNAGIDGDISIKLFGTNGSSSEHVIMKEEGFFERASIDRFQCELDDVGTPIKIVVQIQPKSKRSRNDWYLEKVTITKAGKSREPDTFLFGWNDWITQKEKYIAEIPITKGSRPAIGETTYRITTKTSDIDGAGSDSDVFITLSGENGDSREFELNKSSTHSNKFERNNEDVFTFEKVLSLGQLLKARVRIEESFFKGPWHLEYVIVEDVDAGKTFKFPCDKWLSLKKDDKQLVRELVCDNDSIMRSNTSLRGEVQYQIEITTSDKEDAGTTQYGWIVLEGKKKRSQQFIMKNTERRKVLRRGETNTFNFTSRPLGDIRSIILGHCERPDYPLRNLEGRKSQWHVAHVTVTDPSTGTKYEFPVRKWLRLDDDGQTFECAERNEDIISQQRRRQTIKYEVIVHTGDVSGAGTDANVYIILYGTLGDTGKRHLEQKGRNLFERGQVDRFEVEALDLGELTKLHIEHDNKNLFADWFLDKVEVKNMTTSEQFVFPCERWLSKDKDDRQLQRDLLPFKAT